MGPARTGEKCGLSSDWPTEGGTQDIHQRSLKNQIREKSRRKVTYWKKWRKKKQEMELNHQDYWKRVWPTKMGEGAYYLTKLVNTSKGNVKKKKRNPKEKTRIGEQKWNISSIPCSAERRKRHIVQRDLGSINTRMVWETPANPVGILKDPRNGKMSSHSAAGKSLTLPSDWGPNEPLLSNRKLEWGIMTCERKKGFNKRRFHLH